MTRVRKIWFILCLISFSLQMLEGQEEWADFKEETLLKMSTIAGWCSPEKALLMMDLIREHHCKNCVEIGVFAGMSLFPIARALKYNNAGKVIAIDAWDAEEATVGMNPSDPNYIWWRQLDYSSLFEETIKLIQQQKLKSFCQVIREPSLEASHLLLEESVDFIHFDGSHDVNGSLQDVIAYFPKVRNGGYILLNDANWLNMRGALIYLLERADLISPFSPSEGYLLFRKSAERINNAQALMEEK